jgi:putative DNA-invertase from lambdoid prophage Rac
MKRAALYLRVSTGEQHTENQRPELEQLALARRLDVVLVEEEQATTRRRRPALERVLVAARKRKIDAVVIWAIDRLGRSMGGNLSTILELDRLGVEVVSYREPWLDAAGPTRDLLVAIFSWVAEQERTQISERTRAGMARAKRDGKAIGRPSKSVNATAARSLRTTKTATETARALGVGRSTLYRKLGPSRKGALRKEGPTC